MRATQIARTARIVARSALRQASIRSNVAAMTCLTQHMSMPKMMTSPLANSTSIRSFSSSIDDDNEEYFGDDDEAFIQYPLPSVRVQAVAPNFTAPAVINGEIKELSLNQYRGQYVVLFFYPKDFTYVCPTEIIAFNDRAEEFAAVNTQLLAISCDTAESHLAWTKLPRSKGGLGHMSIPLISDGTKAIANKYGVLLEEDGVALRGLFIMDKDGIVHQMTVNNLPIGRSVDETLRLVKALQFVEEHGEVCPANWQPGDKTIIADPKNASEYFSTVEDKAETHEYEGISVVKNKAELDAVLKKDKLVVAKFEASWCGKCVQIQPFVKELADKYKGQVTFATLDVDLPDVAPLKKAYGIEALPSFRFFKNGKEVGSPVIGYKKTPLKDAVEKLTH